MGAELFFLLSTKKLVVKNLLQELDSAITDKLYIPLLRLITLSVKYKLLSFEMNNISFLKLV